MLAKLMGFYTVEVKNLETGVVQAKHDLLVMENLFYRHKITKKYDLKGIQSRKVKLNQDSPERTLFDGEWLEGVSSIYIRQTCLLKRLHDSSTTGTYFNTASFWLCPT
jgi:1-phosphatidylinositol-3-phosphate 5-kinase